MDAVCPACGNPGRSVKLVTLHSLVREELRGGVSDGPYFVCVSPDCSTVYFDARRSCFDKSSLVVRFGVKETVAPRPVCYCFDHSIESIFEEISDTGRSTVLDRIKADMEGDGCRCEHTNPMGCCCLATVRGFVEAELGRQGHAVLAGQGKLAEEDSAGEDSAGGDSAGGDSTGGELTGCDEGCCSGVESTGERGDVDRAANRSGMLAVAGSVAAAILASACCWLPLVLFAFGASAAGVAGFFEEWRALFLVCAVGLLGVGFYFQYWRKSCCAEGSCSTPSLRVRRMNQAMLWVATFFVVAMLLFPNYVGYLMGTPVATETAMAVDGVTILVPVEGMTCEGCTAILAASLAEIDGVSGIRVSYEDRSATMNVSRGDDAVRRRVVEAILSAGYTTRIEALKELP